MIRFSQRSWFSAVFVYYGGVLPKLLLPTVLYFVYVFCTYAACLRFQVELADDGIKLLAGSTTFMLVFRLNQCHSRLQFAENLIVEALGGLRGIVACACATANCELSDGEREAATLTKMNVARLSIACAVSLKYHLRATELMNSCGRMSQESARHALSDLARIKALLTDVEARLIQAHCGLYEEPSPIPNTPKKPNFAINLFHRRTTPECRDRTPILGDDSSNVHCGCALPPIIVNLIRVAVREPISEKWGYPERVLNVVEGHISEVMRTWRGMHRIVSSGLPVPYLQLCKLLLLIFVLVYPWSIDNTHGVWSNVVIPTILATTMLGLEIVADFMENPLGDDSSDISVYELIHEFEVEVEAIFNCSEAKQWQLAASWDLLGKQFALDGGCKLLAKGRVCGDRPQFERFFVWVPLARHTVEYIAMQSTDSALLDVRMAKHKEHDGGSSDEETTETSRLLHDDTFAVRQCVALRAALPHLKEAQYQQMVLSRSADKGEGKLPDAMGGGPSCGRP